MRATVCCHLPGWQSELSQDPVTATLTLLSLPSLPNSPTTVEGEKGVTHSIQATQGLDHGGASLGGRGPQLCLLEQLSAGGCASSLYPRTTCCVPARDGSCLSWGLVEGGSSSASCGRAAMGHPGLWGSGGGDMR